jgi:FkbM family methyltransferase
MTKISVDSLILGIGESTRDFYMRVNSSDGPVIGQVLVDLAFDLRKLRRYEELAGFLHRARQTGKRPLIIDAGANIGVTSVYLATQCPDALIVAIEPDAANFQILVANTRNLPVLPLPAAVAAAPGRCLLQDPGGGPWAYRTHVVDSCLASPDTIPTVCIDEILEAHRHEAFPFIVKIDIEGAEADVFSAHTSWVDQVPLIIVEPHDWLLPRQRTAQPLLKRLAHADRDIVIIGENIFSMVIDFPGPEARQ